MLGTCMCMCTRVLLWEKVRERGRESARATPCGCVCACVKEGERMCVSRKKTIGIFSSDAYHIHTYSHITYTRTPICLLVTETQVQSHRDSETRWHTATQPNIHKQIYMSFRMRAIWTIRMSAKVTECRNRLFDKHLVTNTRHQYLDLGLRV